MKQTIDHQEITSRSAANTNAVQRFEQEGSVQKKSIYQLVEEEELQGKFKTAQLMGEEEEFQGKFKTAQLIGEDEELQCKFKTAQLMRPPEEELQMKPKTAQLKASPNKTGMPDNLKSGIESLSGVDVSDVRVHYNSSKPAQMNAHAYAQGTNIHLAPGQSKHLPHEAWHTVQQKQGRVSPTTHVNGTPVNDSVSLETEADVMGAKANAH
jgi:hypothetical protein